MRFISIDTRTDGRMAISADAITTIREKSGIVYIFVGADKAIATKFTNIQNAVDYIQRAQSISLSES